MMMKEQKPPMFEYDKDPLSIHYDDDNENLGAFQEFLQEHTERNKNKTAQEIELMGSAFLSEIDNKKKNEKFRIKKLIPYILKYCDGKYTEEELMRYSLEDVKDIYAEYKEKHRNPIIKFFMFLFNL